MPLSGKLKTAVIAVGLGIIFSFARAQSTDDYLQRGDRLYLKKDYENALKNYEQALAADADNPLTNFKAGIACLNQKRYSQAVTYLEKAYSMKPDVDPDIDYHLGVSYQENHQYDRGRKHFEALRGKNKRLAPVANQKIRECIIGDSLMRLPAMGIVEPIDGDINTSFSEFSPLIGNQGRQLIFTSNRSTDDYQVKSRTNAEDVYISERQGQHWSTPRKISDNINVKFNEAATSLSADGKTLFLYYEDGGGDIYTSTLDNGAWTKPVALNRFINHPQYRESSACMSADGKQLFFSSNRPGGKGGFDIYVSTMDANGQWGRPSNLGSTVNTRRDEESPYFHSDGKTLYFSSNGHHTLGDADIFKTSLEKGKWTLVENLGFGINTSAYEGSFVLSEDNTTGYFASRRQHTGEADIYVVKFTKPVASVEPVSNVVVSGRDGTSDVLPDNGDATILKGNVVDFANGRALQATIRLVDNETKKVVSEVDTDQAGRFRLLIPHGGNFGLTTERKGYLFNSMNFAFPAGEKSQEIDAQVLMVRGAVGSKVILRNLFFDINESKLKDASRSELENLRDLLMQNPAWRIQINGHTDNTGQAQANLDLSFKRAQAVVDYLIGQGIPERRLQAKGFGSQRPLASNDDEKEGRQINRRTEIEIIE